MPMLLPMVFITSVESKQGCLFGKRFCVCSPFRNSICTEVLDASRVSPVWKGGINNFASPVTSWVMEVMVVGLPFLTKGLSVIVACQSRLPHRHFVKIKSDVCKNSEGF